jgi:hypothetical protein
LSKIGSALKKKLEKEFNMGECTAMNTFLIEENKSGGHDGRKFERDKE